MYFKNSKNKDRVVVYLYLYTLKKFKECEGTVHVSSMTHVEDACTVTVLDVL